MKKIIGILLILLINTPLNACDYIEPEKSPAEITCERLIKGALIGVMALVGHEIMTHDEPRASLIISHASDRYLKPLKEPNLCTELIPELTAYTSAACVLTPKTLNLIDENKYVAIELNPMDPYCVRGTYDRKCLYKRGTCTIPELDITEKIETMCKSPDTQALEIARAALRQKIADLKKGRTGK